MTAAKRSPFYAGTYAGRNLEYVDADSRVRLVAQFDLPTCRRALQARGLQATVRKAIRRRIRRLMMDA